MPASRYTIALLMLGLAAIPTTASAALIQVANRASLGPALTIPWTAFGPVGSTLAVLKQAVVGPETVGINSSSGVLDVSQQGNGFNGNFAGNAVLLLQPNPDDGETISFSLPVLGFGTDIAPDGFVGAYTAYMAAFDASSALIGVVSVTGNSSAGGSVPFIGATSFADPIAFVTFGLVEPGSLSVPQFRLGNIPVLGNIAIDQASVVITSVPEPSAYIAFMTGALVLAALRRRLN